jgi:hypothetical protein
MDIVQKSQDKRSSYNIGEWLLLLSVLLLFTALVGLFLSKEDGYMWAHCNGISGVVSVLHLLHCGMLIVAIEKNWLNLQHW